MVSKFEIILLFMLSIPLSSLSAGWDSAFAIMHGTQLVLNKQLLNIYLLIYLVALGGTQNV